MNTYLLNLTFAVMLICFVACSSDEPSQNKLEASNNNLVTTETPELTAIRNYIGKYTTRAENVEITPIVEQEDTIMYLAQYPSGWQLFSNSTSAPMVLMKSDSGILKNLLKDDNVFTSFYNSIKDLLKKDFETEGKIFESQDTEWFANNPELANSLNSNNSDEEGEYRQVGAYTYPTVRNVITHLTHTRWFQKSPCNIYMPYQKYFTDQHILVGCTAVATGQFLYYSHHKWGTPTSMPEKASYDSSINKYLFSGSTSALWDSMEHYPGYYANSTALLLGWIAKEINAQPHYDKNNENVKTSAGLNDACNFIKNNSNISAECISYNAKTVSDFILAEKPVILWLYDQGGGHVVIADATDYTKERCDYYYAYVKPSVGTDPTKPVVPDTGTTDDYNYLVSKYGKIYTETQTSEKIFFKFNWGHEYEPEDTWINGKVLEISSSDPLVNGYKYHEIIKYTIN